MSQVPETWAIAALIEICDRIVDGSHNPPKGGDVGYPMLSARNVQTGRILFDRLRLISESDFAIENGRTNVVSGDVLLTIVGTIGRVAVVPAGVPPFALQRSVAVLKPRSVDARFLAYSLETSRTQRWLSENAKGTAQKGIYLNALGDLQVTLAPFHEQSRIVERLDELLTELDAGVAELRAAQKKLAQYRQSLLKAAVEGALTADWRAAHPPQESGEALLARILQERRARWETRQLDKFKPQGKMLLKGWQSKYVEPVLADADTMPSLPEGWTWASVAHVGEVQLGRQRSPDKVGGASPTKYVRAANITEAGINLDDVLAMDFSATELDTFALKPGDVLLAEASGSAEHVGRPAIWLGADEVHCFQNTVLRFTAHAVTSPYAYFLFMAQQKLGVFRRLSGGVGINHLSSGKFSALTIPVPPLDEQEQIAKALKDDFDRLAEQELVIEQLLKFCAAQRQNILRTAFTGQLVPQDPADEPASALLARIRAERAATTAVPKAALRTRVGA